MYVAEAVIEDKMLIRKLGSDITPQIFIRNKINIFIGQGADNLQGVELVTQTSACCFSSAVELI